MNRISASVAAASVLLGGFLTVSGPAAQGAPGDCLDWTFNGGVGLTVTGNFVPADEDGFGILFSSSGKNASGAAKMTSVPIAGDVDGTISGAINGTGIQLTFTQNGGNGVVLPLNGNIGPDGIARGKTGGQFDGGDWTSGQLHCSKKEEAAPEPEKPKVGPTVSGNSVLGGVVVHVKDNSGVTSQCQYDSEIFDRNFTLQANSTADLRFVPAVPLFKDWPVTVTCDNGTSTNANIFF